MRKIRAESVTCLADLCNKRRGGKVKQEFIRYPCDGLNISVARKMSSNAGTNSMIHWNGSLIILD